MRQAKSLQRKAKKHQVGIVARPGKFLATIVQGGDICPRCHGTGMVRSPHSLPEFCPTCGGIGARGVDTGEDRFGFVIGAGQSE